LACPGHPHLAKGIIKQYPQFPSLVNQTIIAKVNGYWRGRLLPSGTLPQSADQTAVLAISTRRGTWPNSAGQKFLNSFGWTKI
jgi:hypothetical protein